MTAFKMLLAGIFAVGALSVASSPVTQPGAGEPGQPQHLSNLATDDPCDGDECLQPPRNKPKYPRHVWACVRGACVPLPPPRSWQ